jgi:RNA polymerase sigma factor (sigma-70 family)
MKPPDEDCRQNVVGFMMAAGIPCQKTMSEPTDHQLLWEFADDGNENAFGRLVDRHLPLVFSAARRKLGDAALAQDVSQQVFTLLARKVRELGPEIILAGWLYRTACHLAARTQRTELRRVLREATAVAHMNEASTESVWRDIEPELDAAMESLGETDRDAVVLRYFQNKSLREVGAALGTSDDAAQKRLSRAIENLRNYFARQGRPVAAASLTAAIVAGAILPAPGTLAAGLSATALSAASLSNTFTTATATSSIITAMTSLVKPAIAAVAGLAATAGLIIQHQQLTAQRAQNVELQARVASLEAGPPPKPIGQLSESGVLAGAEKAELLRLRGEVVRLRLESARARPGPVQGAQASTETEIPASSAIEPEVLRYQIDLLKNVSLALRNLNSDAQQTPELQALKFTPGVPPPKEFLENLGPLASSLDQIELLVPDVKWALKAERTPESIVARSREATPTTDGHYIRAYSLGDGSVHSVRHNSPDEAYGWGQTIDGTPVHWADETQIGATIFVDPVLARRYGLQPAGK